jgi:gliding motility-associated-like protein
METARSRSLFRAVPIVLQILLIPVLLKAQLGTWLARDLNGVYLVDVGTPVPTVGAFVPGLGSSADEDVNVMTDAASNLLFCSAVNTNGNIQVFDANLMQMPAGTGLLGHSSTSHSVISPIPCHPDRYFFVHLFTGDPASLYYSTVDMSLNGGLGDVVNANTPIPGNFNEGLAISHVLPNGCRWLFGSLRNGNNYDLVRCLISRTGIGPPTVIATVSIGTPVSVNDLELDPANTRLAMSLANTSAMEDIAIWDLDLNTGTVSNLQNHAVSMDRICGLQFSPSGQYLYFLGNGVIDAMDFGRLELVTGTAGLIDPNMGRYLIHLELAANGRIYAGMNYNYDFLAEVADPDNPGLANIGYTHDAVFISGIGCRPALPSAIEGEPPGTSTTPAFIDFSAYVVGGCDTYQFVDSTCLATWWEWDLGDGTITNEQAPEHTFAAGTYDITLRVVACGDTLSLTRPAYITSSSAAPVAAFAAPDTICLGNAVNFTNASTQADQYAWDLGDGNTTTDSDPTHTYTAAGTYSVQLVSSNSCLSDTATVDVVVLTQASASFTVGGDTCALQVEVTSTSPGSTTWWWDMGDGNTSELASPAHTYASSGTFTITLITTIGGACSDTAATTVVVHDGPQAAFTYTTVCDQVVTFTDQSTLGGSTLWAFGDGAGASGSPVDHTYASPGTYAVTLTSSNASGCDHDTTMQVVVIADPFADPQWLSGPCDEPHQFTAGASVGNMLQWELGDGAFASGADVVHTYSAQGSYTVLLIAEPGTPCADTASVLVVVAGPIEARPMALVACAGEVLLYDAGQGAITWQWDLGDGSTASADSLLHTYGASGSYTVTLIATNAEGCMDTVAIEVLSPLRPLAQFTAEWDPCTAWYRFNNSSMNAGTYSWNFGDGNGSTLTDPIHQYAVPGSYTVWLVATTAEGCADSTSIELVNEIGDVTAGVFIPNCFTPNDDGVNDHFEVSAPADCYTGLLSIFNRWGELIFETATFEPWNGTRNGRPVPDGVYVYYFLSKGQYLKGHISVLR